MNKTKLKILSGAQQLFHDKGFYGTAIDSLLDLIDVSKGSFFHHFHSKDDLLVEIIDFESQQLFSKFEELFDNVANPLSSLNEFLSWRLETYNTTGRLLYKLGAETANHNIIVQKRTKKIFGDYLAYLMKVINKAKENGQLEKITPTKELANFILYGVEGATLSVKLTDNETHYADVVEMIKRVVRSYRVIDDNE